MPQFESNAIYPKNLVSDIARGYLQAAEFTMDEAYAGRRVRWSRAAASIAERAASDFVSDLQGENADRRDAAARMERVERWYDEKYGGKFDYTAQECIGHDIWFSSNGHGVGFQDRDGLPASNFLHQVAKAIRERHVYLQSGYAYLE